TTSATAIRIGLVSTIGRPGSGCDPLIPSQFSVLNTHGNEATDGWIRTAAIMPINIAETISLRGRVPLHVFCHASQTNGTAAGRHIRRVMRSNRAVIPISHWGFCMAIFSSETNDDCGTTSGCRLNHAMTQATAPRTVTQAASETHANNLWLRLSHARYGSTTNGASHATWRPMPPRNPRIAPSASHPYPPPSGDASAARVSAYSDANRKKRPGRSVI